LTESLIVLMIVEVEDLGLLASSGRVRPYINDAEFPSCRARGQAAMQAEIIALRHQVTVLQRSQKSRRPVLTRMDRCFWVWLSRVWSAWRSALIIVRPETVIHWHRQGFRWYWTWKVRHGRSGRPQVPKETRDLIRTMSRENPLWGAPRIHSELLKLGVKISQASVAKYMVRHRKPPSQTWRTFLNNHVSQLASVDFFTVHTVWFEILFVFIVLAHDRRRVVHFNVTAHATAEWTAQQMLEAFPFDTAPQYLLRDRVGGEFQIGPISRGFCRIPFFRYKNMNE